MYHLLQFVEKIYRKTRALYEINLKVSISRTISKGYQATCDEFSEATEK